MNGEHIILVVCSGYCLEEIVGWGRQVFEEKVKINNCMNFSSPLMDKLVLI